MLCVLIFLFFYFFSLGCDRPRARHRRAERPGHADAAGIPERPHAKDHAAEAVPPEAARPAIVAALHAFLSSA